MSTRKRGHSRRRNPGLVPIVVANPARRTHRRRLPPRGAHGQFLPRGHRSGGGTKKRRRARTAIVANPIRRAPTRRRRYYARPVASLPVRRRRRNPGRSIMRLGTWRQLASIGLGALLGIVVARLVGNAWRKYASATIVGDGTSTWRQWADELGRLVAMELAVWGLSRALARSRLAGATGLLASSILAGGSGEVARQLAGLAVRKFAPSASPASFGLDGPIQQTFYRDPLTGAVFAPSSTTGEYELAGAMDEDGRFYTVRELAAA